MASILEKLIRKSPPARTLAALCSRSSQNISAPFILHRPIDSGTKPDGGPCDFASNPSQFGQFYPSFSFGLFLPQILPSNGLITPFEPEYGDDDSRKMWVDSVKKKRKKKMNKHKYKKLRKRLRRQT